MKEVITYEGVCKYCGQTTPVLAGTQEEADTLVTEECDCAGADAQKRRESVEKNAALIVEGKDGDIIEILRTAGIMILTDKISQLSPNTGEINYQVSVNSKGQIKFIKTKTKQEELQG